MSICQLIVIRFFLRFENLLQLNLFRFVPLLSCVNGKNDDDDDDDDDDGDDDNNNNNNNNNDNNNNNNNDDR